MYYVKKKKNGIKHVVNECIELKELRDKLINELNNLDNKIEKLNTLEKIENFYYSKDYSEKKEKKKKDNKGIKLIKTFIKQMYFKFGKTNNKKDELTMKLGLSFFLFNLIIKYEPDRRTLTN